MSDYEIERVRENLEKVVNSSLVETTSGSTMTSKMSLGLESEPIHTARIKRLEHALTLEQESNQQIHKQLEAQNKRLDAFLSFHENLARRENEAEVDATMCTV